MATKITEARREQNSAETLLLVEDDERVIDLTKRILEGFGYTVVTARNGLEGLNRYCELKDKIALVILEFMLPVISGRKCLEKLFEINPDVKILVTSGHSVCGIAETVIKSGAKGFIPKPYSIKQILSAVRQALDSS